MRRLLAIGCVVCLFIQGSALAEDTRTEARIGVLAYRGSDQLQIKWLALRDYLNAAIPDWSFRIVPMTLSSAAEQIESGQVDFIITNPGHFVDLNRTHRMSVLASRSQRKSDGTFSGEFGSAIIALKDSGIQRLQDVAGRTVSAIDPNAFGGFQIAWYEFDRANVDLFADPSSLRFVGFPMDQVVMQVMAGEADVGIVRSGLLEELASEGRIDPKAFVHLNTNVTYSHPDKVSTNLYPEWPFAALAATDPALKDRVALALLLSRESAASKANGMIDTWSAPVPYHSAVVLTEAFQARLSQLNSQDTTPARLVVWVILTMIVATGGAYWWHRTARTDQTDDAKDHPDKAEEAGLTRRERQILALVAQGNSTKEIAIELGISPKTVEFHRSNLLRKFGARTSSQLIALAT